MFALIHIIKGDVDHPPLEFLLVPMTALSAPHMAFLHKFGKGLIIEEDVQETSAIAREFQELRVEGSRKFSGWNEVPTLADGEQVVALHRLVFY